MGAQVHHGIVERWFHALFAESNLAAIDELVSPEVAKYAAGRAGLPLHIAVSVTAEVECAMEEAGKR